ncbi:MAG TPA: SRPBCC domain-containing protein [Chthonomonadaceae bacterium]|nr:SRPBCC domain-containing protein [Chthonomonadaceae bacterium]
MSKQVRMDVVLPQPPERVWRALTDSRALAQWLMPNDFSPRLGQRFRFLRKRGREEKEASAIQCEVVELEAPHRLAYTWRENPEAAPDLVTWALEPVEAGTRLRLEHTRLTDLQACASGSGQEAQPAALPRSLLTRLARFLVRKHRIRGNINSGGILIVCHDR